MGYGYSVDFRNKVVQAIIKLGLTHKATAEIFDIGEATITRWLRRYKERGNLNPEPHAGGRKLGIGNGEHLNRLAATPGVSIQHIRKITSVR
ncbi:MAG TPA: hypothetical protein EYO58_11040, partial [Flavobacteriales bacterium]|nr:hypothetical protein [Flavobacteriales bacterium]